MTARSSLVYSGSMQGTMGSATVSGGTMQGTMQGFGTPVGAAAATAMTFGLTKEQAVNWVVLAAFVPSELQQGPGFPGRLHRGLAFVTYLRYISEANRRKVNCQDLMATSLTTVLPLTTGGDYIRLDQKSRLQAATLFTAASSGQSTYAAGEPVEHLDIAMVGAALRCIQGLDSGELALLIDAPKSQTLIWEAPHRPGTYRGPMKMLDLECESCVTVAREHYVDIVLCRHGSISCYPLGGSKCRRTVNPTFQGSYLSFVYYDRLDSQIYAVDKSDLKLIFRFDACLESQKLIKLSVPNDRSFKPAEVASLDGILLVTSATFSACAVVDKHRHHVLQLLHLHSEEIITDEPMIKLIGKGLAIDPDLGLVFIGSVSNINQNSISVLYLDEDTGTLADLATIMSPCQPMCMAFFRQQGLLVLVDELNRKILNFLYLNYDLFKTRMLAQKSHDRAIRLQLSGFDGLRSGEVCTSGEQFVTSRVFPVLADTN